MGVLTKLSDGWSISVRVKPKSSRNEVLGVRENVLHIAVTAVPEKGKANAAVIKLLAKQLQIPKSSIEILSGETNSNKLLKLPLISVEELADRLNLTAEDLCG